VYKKGLIGKRILENIGNAVNLLTGYHRKSKKYPLPFNNMVTGMAHRIASAGGVSCYVVFS